MRVDIYITTKFHGKISKGNGTYAILLDAEISGTHYKKMHTAGWKNLSFQKLAARAAVEGIQYMTAPSDVVIHTDSPYAANVMRSGKADGKKYERLWGAYFEAASKMKSVEILFEKEHKYRTFLLGNIKMAPDPVMEDNERRLTHE